MTIREIEKKIMSENKGDARRGFCFRRENVTGRKVNCPGYLTVWEENNFEVVNYYHDEMNDKWIIEY